MEAYMWYTLINFPFWIWQRPLSYIYIYIVEIAIIIFSYSLGFLKLAILEHYVKLNFNMLSEVGFWLFKYNYKNCFFQNVSLTL